MLSRHVLLKGDYLRKLDAVDTFSSAVETMMDTLSPTTGGLPDIRLGQEIPSRKQHLALITESDHTLFTRIEPGREDGQVLILRNANSIAGATFPMYFANFGWRFEEQPAGILNGNLDLGYADFPSGTIRQSYKRDANGMLYYMDGATKITVPEEVAQAGYYTESILPGESLVFMYNLPEQFWFLVSVPFAVDGGTIA